MPQLGKVLIAKYAFAAITQLNGIYLCFTFATKSVLERQYFPKVDSSHLSKGNYCALANPSVAQMWNDSD